MTKVSYQDLINASQGTPLSNLRTFVDNLYDLYSMELDNNFLKELRSDRFIDKYCELIYIHLLTTNKLVVKRPAFKKNTSSYDFNVTTLNGFSFALEITCAQNTENGGNHVPEAQKIEREYDGVDLYSTKYMPDKLQMRFSTRVEEKIEQYNKFIKAGNINEDTPYVIGIGAYGFPSSTTSLMTFFSIPTHYLGVFFPLGDPIVYFDTPGNSTAPDMKNLPNSSLKLNNISSNYSEISKCIFLDKKYSCISAVLLSYKADGLVQMGNSVDDALYNDLILIHNPFAKNKLPARILPVAVEHCAELTIHTTHHGFCNQL